ncbi:MAG: ImmA/IrrE family metallo-endopeptidase [Bacteroidetes bacterium]|nr:ImmA/IrrE family metallo-endopeptidase [Bacteroidota bacterium]
MMKTNKEIEQIAGDVLAKYAKRGGSYKVFGEVMQGEKIKFKELTAGSTEFIGALTKGNNGQVYVMVNGTIDNIGRKNFTIAHELGHYFLSHQLKQNSFYCSDKVIVEEGSWNDPIEQEANYFASCFLMPEQKVKPAFLTMLANSRKTQVKDFLLVKKDTFSVWAGIKEELTKRYGVSEAALRFRLQGLGVAKFEFVN